MTNEEHAKEAASAMANLSVLDAVVGAVENGATTHLVDEEVQQIIGIAKKGQRRMLKKYDKHIASISAR